MARKPASFSFKWTAAFSIVFICFFAVTHLYIYTAVSGILRHQTREALSAKLNVMARLSPTLFEDRTPATRFQKFIRDFLGSPAQRITMIDADGVVIADSSRGLDEIQELDNHLHRAEIELALRQSMGAAVRQSITLRKPMHYVAKAVRSKDAALLGFVRVGVPLEIETRQLKRLRRTLMISFALMLLAILTTGWALSVWMKGQMRRLTVAALKQIRGDLSQRIIIDGDDELRALAESMNHMSAALKTRIREAEEKKIQLAAVLENMSEGVLALNGDGTIVVVNSAAEEMLGIRREDVLGQSFIESVCDHHLAALLNQAREKGGLAQGEVPVRRPTAKLLKVNAVTVSRGDSSVEGLLVLHDVTQIRKLERLRRDFVANVSHELKTPITSLKGFIETLLSGALSNHEQSKQFLAMMEDDTNRLIRLVNDLLELSKIESGEMVLHKQVCDPSAEVAKVELKLKKTADKYGVSFENRVPAGDFSVIADPDKLVQILLNLADNAVKFNRSGGRVVFSADREERHLRLSVQDTGPGIPSAVISRVFERFFRVDNGRSRDQGGTGLGLAIVKHLVEAHGGSVFCESTMGQGTTFSFTLPVVVTGI